MADDRNTPKGVASVLYHGQRLRRCLSDRTLPINFNREEITVLKIPRRQGKDKENIPVLSPSATPKMALSLQSIEAGHLAQGSSVSEMDSDEEMKLSQEFNFDKNNNDSLRAESSSTGNDIHTPPPSPTWNLKMLCEAVSPEIRRMQREKELNAEEGRSSTTSSSTYPVVSPTDDNSRDCMDSALVISREVTATDMDVFTSRKDKSLGKLCDKFLSRYPEYPPTNSKIEICLDQVAKDLAVERRRIYDIVNVLESVEIVSRQAKNRYIWHGKTNLPHTLVKLKNTVVYVRSPTLEKSPQIHAVLPEADQIVLSRVRAFRHLVDARPCHLHHRLQSKSSSHRLRPLGGIEHRSQRHRIRVQ